MAGKDKDQKPTNSSRRVTARDVLTRPAAAEALEALGIGSQGKALPSNGASAEALAALNTKPSADVMKLLSEQDVNFQNFAASLLKPSTNLLDTLDPGEEFVGMTAEMALKKGTLTELEILQTPPSSEALAALKVGVVMNKDNTERVYLTGKKLDDYMVNSLGLGSVGTKNFMLSTIGESQRDIAKRYLGQIVDIQPGQLHPGLVERMKRDPEVAMYANYAVTAGEKAGINGIMYANQLWQESRFNEDAVSGKGARGIAQMMPYHQGKYGLQSTSDFFDGFKSIDAGAAMMFEMTNRYKDQRLALVAYNGGGGAIDFVEKKLGKDQITYGDWHQFMEQRRTNTPTSNPSAWQNETFDYLHKTGAGRPENSPAVRPAATSKPEPALK